MTESHPQYATPTARDLMRETELLIPLEMSVEEAGGMLDAVGGGIAPVVDPRGRCVGVFTAAVYRQWLNRVVSDADTVTNSVSADEVRFHITGQFGTATLEAGVQELLHRLDAAADPFLVILDRQARPRGVVCALDVLVAQSDRTRNDRTRSDLSRTETTAALAN